MAYTMRSAFKHWLELHNEKPRISGPLRIPNWFRFYIRNNTDWSYTLINESLNHACNAFGLDSYAKRRHKGFYTFEISDEELLNLERPEWIKEVKEFKAGDRVYHKSLKLYGVFIEYDWTGKDECHVNFNTPRGYERILHVTTKEIILIKQV